MLTYTMNRLLDHVIVTLSGTLHSIRRISKEIIKYSLHSVNILEFYLRISSKTSMFLTKLKSSVFSNAHFSLGERFPIGIAGRVFLLERSLALKSSAKLPGLVQSGLYLLL